MATLSRLITAPKKLYITRQARQAIEDEARRHHDPAGIGHETGGILIGRRLDQEPDAILIVAATGPGPNARRSELSFEPDTDYANQELGKIRALYPQVDYIGTWHKHPPGLLRFSAGDVATAHQAFADPDYKMQEVVSPIVTVDDDGQVAIRYYYMSRRMARSQEAFIDLGAIETLIDESDERISQERLTRVFDKSLLETTPNWVNQEQQSLNLFDYNPVIRRDNEHKENYYFIIKPSGREQLTIYIVTTEGHPEEVLNFYAEQDTAEITLDQAAITRRWRQLGQPNLTSLVEQILAEIDRTRTIVTTLADESRRLTTRRATSDTPVLAMAVPAEAAELYAGSATAEVKISQTGSGERRDAEDDRDDPPTIIGSRRPGWVLAAIGLVAVLLFAIGLGIGLTFQGTSGGQTAGFATSWALIDTALAGSDMATLQTAEGLLSQIQTADPTGTAYPRNLEVGDALADIYLLMGDLQITAVPPDTTAARAAYTKAQGLGADPTAVAERLLQIDQLIQQANLRKQWEQIDAATNPAEKVDLIVELRASGVTVDLEDQPIAQRLHTARLEYARSLQAAQSWAEAVTVLQDALNDAPDDAATQAATNLLAAVYLAQGDVATAEDRAFDAINAYRTVLSLDPAPQAATLQRAQASLDAITRTLDQQTLINTAWLDADQALRDGNLERAIAALMNIVDSAGLRPDPVIFGVAPYDSRTPTVGIALTTARLDYALQLGRAGRLTAAQNQHASARAELQALSAAADPTIAGDIERVDDRLNAESRTLGRATQLWGTVTTALTRQDWVGAQAALLVLRDLPGFGRNAIRPNDGRSVDALLQVVRQQLTPAPTATPIPPTPAVEATAPVPEPTPIPTQVQQIQFQVTFTIITEEEMRTLQGGAICEGCNGFILPFEEGARLNLIDANGTSSFFTSGGLPIRLGVGIVTTSVASADGSQPIVSAEQSEVVAGGTYYRIVVSRV